MRLSEDKIKQGILHPDAAVRLMAVHYFADSFSEDPTVMPLLIEAIEKYDWRSGVGGIRSLGQLVQTDQTLSWLLQELARDVKEHEENASRYREFLLESLVQADVHLLAQRQSELDVVGQADADAGQAIAHRILLLSADADKCWAELEAFCEREKSHYFDDVDVNHAYRLAEAIARHGQSQAERVLNTLKEDVADLEDDPKIWALPLAARLAGEMRLEAAIPLIVAKLREEEDDDLLLEECEQALRRIATDAVVEALANEYASSEYSFRISAAAALEDIHCDLTVAKCLDLLPREDDSDMVAWLARALVRQLAFDAIEPVRQTILRFPGDAEIEDVRDELIIACELMETTVPELEQWKKDSEEGSRERARRLAEYARDLADAEYDEAEGDEYDEGEYDEGEYDEGEYDEEDAYEAIEPIRREQPPVGRNDPCPCGSGKKYKKCCLGKQRQEQAVAAQRFPIGAVALYGPDAKRTTKIVASVFVREGAEPIMKRWFGNNLKDNPKVQREIQAFLKEHHVRSVAANSRNMGCPHEEGIDFPHGGDCPQCPFWTGKQGSGATGARSFDTLG
jgi:hypothetical protein